MGLIALSLQVASPTTAIRTESRWGVNYDANQCVITRSFDVQAKSATLAIDTNPVTGMGDFVLLLPEGMTRPGNKPVVVHMSPGQEAFQVVASDLASASGHAAVRISFNREAWDHLLSAQAVSIDGITSGDPIVVPVKGIDKAVAAAKQCGGALLASWGANADAMIDDPLPLTRWFKASDYPNDALRHDQQGVVKALVVIDAGGKATECRIVVSSQVPSLDRATCAVLMARVRYDPSEITLRYLFDRTIWIIPRD
nr:TonB family protein [Sphingomonas insulae]